MDNVTILDMETQLDIPPERVLDGASQLCPVLVVGRDVDGEIVVASSTSDAWSNYTLIREALRQLEANAEPFWQARPNDE